MSLNKPSTAAEDRSALSSQRLARKYGDVLRRWAGVRRRTWGITDTWTAGNILTFLDERQRSGNWEPLGVVMRDVAELDRRVRFLCGVYSPRALRLFENEIGATGRTVTEIHDAMRETMPSVTRRSVHKALARTLRRNKVVRVKRGSYIYTPYSWQHDEWHEARESMDDPDAGRWEEHMIRQEHMRRLVLLSHYLLPRRASYRKAKDLGIAERTYYYYLARAIEMLDPECIGKRVQF